MLKCIITNKIPECFRYQISPHECGFLRGRSMVKYLGAYQEYLLSNVECGVRAFNRKNYEMLINKPSTMGIPGL